MCVCVDLPISMPSAAAATAAALPDLPRASCALRPASIKLSHKLADELKVSLCVCV